MSDEAHNRVMPIGAEIVEAGVHFRLWAPQAKRVEVVFDDSREALVLTRDADGYFEGLSTTSVAGTRYRYRLDGGEPMADPASRSQPDGVHGSSAVVDPKPFRWTDESFPGLTATGQILYELHVGTFTREGTYASAIERLPMLAELGITCIELMPLNAFAGRFGWGYDGVLLYAPHAAYGTPDDLRRFIDTAHARGIGVILDVVYNHLGPDGNVLPKFTQHYCSETHKNDWGSGLNFDGESAKAVREFVVENAIYWLREFHFDGLRLDATQAILDDSPRHILAELTERCRAAAKPKSIYIINENEPQDTKFVRSGFGMDALWNDDFHHGAMAVLSGHSEAYYTDHLGRPQEFISAAKYGYLFQGQRYTWSGLRRGTPSLDLPASSFVHFIQNHDQIANSGRGWRASMLASPPTLRAMTVLLLLMPQTSLLFQGQEWAATSPFHYFTDHHAELASVIAKGRREECKQFPSAGSAAMVAGDFNPSDAAAFEASKLKWEELDRPLHRAMFELHRDLISLRKSDPVFAKPKRRGDIDGAVLGHDAFVLRYFGDDGDDRLLLVNFGADLPLTPAPEPLLAPPARRRWAMQMSSEHPKYGGSGTPPPDTEDEGWLLHGRCAIVMRSASIEAGTVQTRFAKSAPTKPVPPRQKSK